MDGSGRGPGGTPGVDAARGPASPLLLHDRGAGGLGLGPFGAAAQTGGVEMKRLLSFLQSLSWLM